MSFRRLASLLVAVPFWVGAAPLMEMPSRTLDGAPAEAMAFRAPLLATVKAASLEAIAEKAALAVTEQPSGVMRVGTVRPLAKAAAVDAWTPVPGGFATRFSASSEGALGLRVRLALAGAPAAIEARVQGDDGRIEFVRFDPAAAAETWTPWTEGSAQVIELFTAVAPPAGAVGIADILHFTTSPFAKAAASCTVPTLCATGDPILDAAVAERKRSMVKMIFTRDGSGYACSGTLINSERFPAAFVLTANHCIDIAQAAGTVTTLWFYETVGCDDLAVNPAWVQVAGGAQLVFTNHNVDSTLLQLNSPPPAGAVYSSWSRARLSEGDPVVSLSHPRADTARLALGTMANEFRIVGHPQDMYGVRFSRGIIESGSSGSGLFTVAGGSLQLRGILSGSTVRQEGGLSCTNLDEEALYGRFEIFQPQIDQYIRLATQAADDAPNRPRDLFNTPVTDTALNLRTSALVLSGRRIDYAGDLDVYRFTLTRDASVTIESEGSIDTVGSLLDSRGVNLESNDDVARGNLNFGITRSLTAGTYYVLVGHWEAEGTGAYGLRMSATASSPSSSGTNYTDLWWTPAEPGWGINLNHQGNIIFGTLFTYDLNGQPMWLVLSNGERQSDGSYLGALHRTRGPAFNASPWVASSIAYTQVGTMRIVFAGASVGQLIYSVNGVELTKNILRMAFSTPTTCTWTTTDRSGATNYQDLWWDPNESGWGVNVTHQGDNIFATLFTYDASGQGLWLSMSNGARAGGSRTYSGTLYRTTGPAFNASNWTATPIGYSEVGTMTFAFHGGNSGTLTYTVDGLLVSKSIQRLTFSTPTPVCSP